MRSFESTDADLVASYRRSGRIEDFECLVLRYRERLLRLVYSVLGSELEADAEDIVQLVFVRAHDRLGSFRGESLFGTWLHRIAYNLAIDHKRKQLRRRHLLRRDEEKLDPGLRPRVGADLSPEYAESIRRALLEVPDPYQAALRLRYWFDLPVADIATSLGVTEATAKSYLHRGRKRLHIVLKSKGLDP